MEPVRVLIVDDSDFVRAFLGEILAADREIKVVGQAANGMEALALVERLKPDIVTMDIEMPEMDGMTAIRHIMASEHALPILVLTSLDDARTACEAVSRGALEVLPKPDMDQFDTGHFTRRLKLLSQVKVVRHICGGYGAKNGPARQVLPRPLGGGPEIIAIASSTGGPGALSTLFTGLEHPLNLPVVVAQHIAPGFEDGLVSWLDSVVPLARVKKGVAGEPLLPGIIYISPSDGHMMVTSQRCLALDGLVPSDIYVPSCDRLLASVAASHGPAALAIVLTGMGDDGTRGALAVKREGGTTIAQDKESSVVYGMPGAALESGCIDQVLSLQEISHCINGIIRKRV